MRGKSTRGEGFCALAALSAGGVMAAMRLRQLWRIRETREADLRLRERGAKLRAGEATEAAETAEAAKAAETAKTAETTIAAEKTEASEAGAETGQLVIVQPVRSGDPRLAETMRPVFEHAHRARIVWLVDEDDHEGIRVTKELLAENGGAGAEIRMCSPLPDGINPKIHKIADLFDELSGDDILLVLDDDTIVSAAGIDAMLDRLAAGAMIGTGLPQYDRQGPAPARLLADWVNQAAPVTYLGLGIDPTSINGMCWAMRVDTLREIGGLRTIEKLLTDDLAVAELVLRAGGEIGQTSEPQLVSTHLQDFRGYIRQQHRWLFCARVYLRRTDPAVRRRVIVETLAPTAAMLAGIGFAVAGSVRALRGGRPASAVFLGIIGGGIIGARAAISAAAQREAYGAAPANPLGALAAEALTPLHALHALLDPTVMWRGRRLRVHGDTTFDSLGIPGDGAKTDAGATLDADAEAKTETDAAPPKAEDRAR